ncbi:MAG: hypothetical protein ACRDCW_06705 [Sarcina sp.]
MLVRVGELGTIVPNSNINNMEQIPIAIFTISIMALIIISIVIILKIVKIFIDKQNK